MSEKPTHEELVGKIKELEQESVKRKQMEKALQESEERYRQIFNIAPAGIYEVDFRTGKFINVNEAVCEYSGYTRDELLSMNAIDVLTKDSQDRLLSRMVKALNKKDMPDSVDYEIIKKDGSTGWLRINNRYIYDGENIIGSTVVAQNITERRRAEEELKKSEQKFRTLVNAAPYGIQLTDKKGKIVYSNPAHHAIQGYADGKLIGRYIWDLIIDEEKKIRTKKYYADLIENISSPVVYFNKNQTKDGRLIDVQINWDYIRNTSGDVEGIISIVRDITEKKQLEDALHESNEQLIEMNAALNALIQNMEVKESDFQEQVTANIQHLVLPYLHKLKDNTANSARKSLIDIVELNLNKITANFTHQLSSSLYSLTSTEIKVADLVRLGKTTKEIATTLNISHKTVESHRERIRKKLGISNQKINLRSHLLSII
jgi:PAS domain S-box-containing protein